MLSGAYTARLWLRSSTDSSSAASGRSRIVFEQLRGNRAAAPCPTAAAQLELLEEFQQVGVLGLRRLVVVAVRRRDVRARAGISRPRRSPRSCIPRSACARRCAGACRPASLRPAGRARNALRDVSNSIAPRFCARLVQDLVQLVQALDLRQQRADERQRLRRDPRRACPRRPRSRPACRSGARANSSPLRRTSTSVTSPSRSTCMSQTKHRRSTFGFSEQMPLDSVSGSIGTTKPGKYTEVARLVASSSSGVPGSHVVRDVGDRDDQAEAVADSARNTRRRRNPWRPRRRSSPAAAGAGRRARRRSRHRTSSGTAAACASTSGGNSCGISWPWIAASTASDARQPVAEHREHAADRGPPRIGRLHDFAHHQLPVLRFEARVGRDHDVALDALVVGHDVTDAGFDRCSGRSGG